MTKSASILLTAWAIAALGAAPRAAAQAAHPKRDAALQAVSGPVRVIVRTRAGQSSGLADALARRGRQVLRRHAIIDAFTALVSPEDLNAFDADPSILNISIDAVVSAASDGGGSATSAPASTLLATLGVGGGGPTGRGVGIGVIDSGIELNGDFAGVRFVDFTPLGSPNAYDDDGHGTHVSGLIAGSGALSNGSDGAPYAGVAPKARLVCLKVLDAHGVGQTSDVIAAIEYAIVNRVVLGIDVLNLSLGHPILEPAATDPLVRAVEAASRAGITVIAAAGNVGRNIYTGQPGYAGILSPANAPSAIAVGAVDTKNTVSRGDDAVASYSSRGPTMYDAAIKPDVVAPGHNLVSDAAPGGTLYGEHPDHQVTVKGATARYFRMSGTSMAAAVTTGVAALVIEAARTSRGA
ncbi:MAG TPA: S8 family serine peptidase, partial [Vicinamibacterales bacterium]